MHLQHGCSQLMEMPELEECREKRSSPKHTGGSRCPAGPHPHPSMCHHPNGVMAVGGGRSGRWLARPSTSTDSAASTRNQAGAPHLQKSACSESNKVVETSLGYFCFHVSPLQDKAGDSELPTATPSWRCSEREPGHGAEKLRLGPTLLRVPDSPHGPSAALITP